MMFKHIKCSSGENEMAEAAVKVFIKVEAVERINKVSAVEVSVDTEHLPKDSMTYIEELL